MNKFLLGLVLGTLLGFLFAQSVSDKDSAVPSPTAVHTTTIAAADRPKLISEPAGSTAGEPQPPPHSALPTDALIATAPSVVATTPQAVAAQPGRAANPTATTSGQRTPIALPETIRPLLEKTDTHDGLTLAQTHAKLEEEPDDLAWSYQMEMYLQQSLARPTKSGQPLDIRVIECRTTLCEIVGFSPLENPSDDLSAAVQYMSQQPWWDFDNFNLTVAGDNSGGKFLAFLHRKGK